MNKQAVYHKAKSSYCYAYNENEIHIRIKTAKNDCQKIEIVYGDKYEWHHAKFKEMILLFIIALAVFAYICYVLLKPEKF